MLIVNPPPYRGRFRARAVELLNAGHRVGEVWVSGTQDWTCHVCGGTNPTPTMADQDDAWVTCSCGVPFVVRKA